MKVNMNTIKSVIKKGVRRGKLKYFCKDCCCYFQINRSKKLNSSKLLLSHMSGLSFRTIADDLKICDIVNNFVSRQQPRSH